MVFQMTLLHGHLGSNN